MKTNLTNKEVEAATTEICTFLNRSRKAIAFNLSQNEIENMVVNWVNGNLMVAHSYGYRIEGG